MRKLEIPEGEKCGLCQEDAKYACPFCLDEYETGPDIPTSFYCATHYTRVVETGNCCYGSEKVFGGSYGSS